MGGERAVHPDCRNSSNPYHECSEYCFKIIAEAKKLAIQNQPEPWWNPGEQQHAYRFRLSF